MRRGQGAGLLAALLACVACGDDTSLAGGGGEGGAGGDATGGAGGSSACEGAALEPEPPDQDACARMLAGAPGTEDPILGLSAAHALARFFGPTGAYAEADAALTSALASPDAIDLDAYAEQLADTLCALDAVEGAALPAAQVELVGEVAVVRPGVGAVVLPEGAAGVAIDLRGLPSVEGLREALEAAVAPAIATPIPRPALHAREHEGMTDEVFSASNVYQNRRISIEQSAIEPAGATDRPLAILTDARLAPEAAAFAIALRRARRAWLMGEDVLARTAESRWVAVGARGVMVRTHALHEGGSLVPDVEPADVRSASPECLLQDLPGLGEPPPPSSAPADRDPVERAEPFSSVHEEAHDPATVRAALVVAHGGARWFFPYFDVVGDTIDARLLETLPLATSVSARREMAHALRRFGEALHDGHAFVLNFGASDVVGCMPAYLEDLDGEAVVRREAVEGLEPGDTIVSIDGVDADAWFAEELARTSAASDGYRFDIASRQLTNLTGALDLEVRDPAGAVRAVTVQPQPFADCESFGFTPTLRPHGFLADLGAPTTYYLNLSDAVLTSNAAVNAALNTAKGATGLVLDMRGYPGIDTYAFARRLIQTTFSSPIFRVTRWSGPDTSTVDVESYPFDPSSNPSFAGPIVLLVGHKTVSAAENCSTMLVDAGRVHVIGRTSAAANGNITGLQLPGAFGFSFTGMDVRHADAQQSVFHGVGIVPEDGDVTLDAAELAAGVDPELMDALAWLAGGG